MAHFLFLTPGRLRFLCVILFFIRRHQPSCHPLLHHFSQLVFKSSLFYFRRILRQHSLGICIKFHRCLISNRKTHLFIHIQLSQITITLITYILPHFIIKYTLHEDLRGYNCALTSTTIDFLLDVNTPVYCSNPFFIFLVSPQLIEARYRILQNLS